MVLLVVLPSEDMNIRRIGQIRAGFLAWNSALIYISRKLLADSNSCRFLLPTGDASPPGEDMSPPGELAFETLGRAHDKAEKRFILPWREKVRESAPMSKPQRIRHLRIVGMICKCSHKKFLNYRFLFLLTFPIRRKA